MHPEIARADAFDPRQSGARFTLDSAGTDVRGANVLADDRSAPSGATTYNTNLVHVEALDTSAKDTGPASSRRRP